MRGKAIATAAVEEDRERERERSEENRFLACMGEGYVYLSSDAEAQYDTEEKRTLSMR